MSTTTVEQQSSPDVGAARVAVRRFSWWARATHATLALAVFGLVLTGMPMRYPDSFWAGFLLGIWQGHAGAAALHKVFATMFFAAGAMHIAGVVAGLVTGQFKIRSLFGPDSIVPKPSDVRHVSQYMRFLRDEGPRPEFGRFTFFEKFDYLAEIWGLIFIGVTGLVMWFPVRAAHVLPGWLVNASLIFHSYEALLAMGFLFTVHFFNTHLRPEVFPVDEVIFSGNIPMHEVQERYPGWYKRLVSSGQTFIEDRGTGKVALLISGFYLTVGFVILVLVMATVLAETVAYMIDLLGR